MEEVDRIILRTLRGLGSDLDESITSVGQLTSEQVVDGCARCLNLIGGKDQYPLRLPVEMSGRFRVCTALAQGCQEAGYKGDVGYHQFLYVTEKDARRLFMWLIEKLPREKTDGSESLTPSERLQRDISSALSSELRRPWRPRSLLPSSAGWRPTSLESAVDWYADNRLPLATKVMNLAPSEADRTKASAEAQSVWEVGLPAPYDQCYDPRLCVPSLQEWCVQEYILSQECKAAWSMMSTDSTATVEEKRRNKRAEIEAQIRQLAAKSGKGTTSNDPTLEEILGSLHIGTGRDGAKNTRFVNLRDLQVKGDTPQQPIIDPKAEEEAQERERRVREQEAHLQQLQIDLAAVKEATAQLTATLQDLEKEAVVVQKEITTREEEYRLKKEALARGVQDAMDLERAIEENVARLKALGEQWEQHRDPLNEQLRQLQEAQAAKTAETRQLLEETARLGAESRRYEMELGEKERLVAQLKGELGQQTHEIAREKYTDRIYEMIRSIQRQQEEITKVMGDARDIQKDIQRTEELLQRVFSEAEEMVFEHAKTNAKAKEVYKLLVTVHENCNNTVKAVQAISVLKKELLDLEAKQESMRKQVLSQNMAQIERDLQAMRAENEALALRLQAVMKL